LTVLGRFVSLSVPSQSVLRPSSIQYRHVRLTVGRRRTR
jgi:hypothetical protein